MHAKVCCMSDGRREEALSGIHEVSVDAQAVVCGLAKCPFLVAGEVGIGMHEPSHT